MAFDPSRTQVFSRQAQFSPLQTPHSIAALSRNPQQSRAALAAPNILRTLSRPIPPSQQAATVLSSWFVLTIHVARPGKPALTSLHVLANRPDGTPVLTTEVKQIDLDKHLVKTMNSLYQLPPDKQGQGEPTSAQLLQAWKNLARWGHGEAFGIPASLG